MDKIIEKSLNIIISNKIEINITDLKTKKSNFFSYLFSSLNTKELDKFILQCCQDKDYVLILYNNFQYLYCHISQDVCETLINYLFKNKMDIAQLLNMFKLDTYSIEQYNRLTTYLNKIPSYKCEFIKQNSILYDLKEKIKYNSNELNADIFEKLIIIPLSKSNGNDYLEFALKKLQIKSSKIEYMKNGRGSYSWCFKTNDLVLKLSSNIVTWNIPIFYRINDFIIRKKFNFNIIGISPYGNVEEVTNQDIYDALNDFEENNLELTDGNYQRNFAVVDYEIPNSMFRDVDGITKYLKAEKSNTFNKKQVKLIDQDFIYYKTDENKIQGLIKTFK